MKLFVTGGTGFLGQRLVAALLKRDAQVYCLVRSAAGQKSLDRLAAEYPGRIHFVHGTLSMPETYFDALKDCTAVYHVAAAMKGATAVLFQNNVVATRQFVHAAGRAGAGRFVSVSSLAVYGPHHLPEGGILDETCPLDPQPHLRDAYAFSKHAQEAATVAAAAEERLPLVIVRPGVIYGPGRPCITDRVGVQIGGLLFCMGGRQRIPCTYVTNCAEAVAVAGLMPGIDGEAINIVDDDLPTAAELIGLYQSEVAKLRTIYVPQAAVMPMAELCRWYNNYSRGQLPAVMTPYKSGPKWKVLNYSNDKARRLLHWRPTVDISEGLAVTFAVEREQNRLMGIGA